MVDIKMDAFIGSHFLGEEEKKALVEIIDSQSLFRYDGPHWLNRTGEFEEAIKEYFDVENALACSSGACALKLACIALGIEPGDEVIMSPFTYIASAGAVMACGAVPVFVDVDESMNIDPRNIEYYITEKTKAIMAIHMQGVPCKMDIILDIARKYKLKVIEDCAQAFGVKYKGKFVGTFGDAAAFSLQANKIITCGEGGIFICKNEAQYKKGVQYHDNGGKRMENSYPIWNDAECSFGENFKITELQSAVALEQLKKVNKIIENQKSQYQELVSNLVPMRLRAIPEEATCVPVSLCIIFDTCAECEEFINITNVHNVSFDFFSDKNLTTYTTFRKQKSWNKYNAPYCYTQYSLNECEYTLNLSNRTAWLPIHPLWSNEEIKYISNVINNAYTEITIKATLCK